MALPKLKNASVKEEMHALSEFLTSNLEEFIKRKYQRNLARILLEFYDYDLKTLFKDIADADFRPVLLEDNVRKQRMYRSMNNGILDTFDDDIFVLMKTIWVVFDEEKKNK